MEKSKSSHTPLDPHLLSIIPTTKTYYIPGIQRTQNKTQHQLHQTPGIKLLKILTQSLDNKEKSQRTLTYVLLIPDYYLYTFTKYNQNIRTQNYLSLRVKMVLMISNILFDVL